MIIEPPSAWKTAKKTDTDNSQKQIQQILLLLEMMSNRLSKLEAEVERIQHGNPRKEA